MHKDETGVNSREYFLSKTAFLVFLVWAERSVKAVAAQQGALEQCSEMCFLMESYCNNGTYSLIKTRIYWRILM